MEKMSDKCHYVKYLFCRRRSRRRRRRRRDRPRPGAGESGRSNQGVARTENRSRLVRQTGECDDSLAVKIEPANDSTSLAQPPQPPPPPRPLENLPARAGSGPALQSLPPPRLRSNLQVYPGPGLTIQPMPLPRPRPNRQAQAWRLLAWERPEWS